MASSDRHRGGESDSEEDNFNPAPADLSDDENDGEVRRSRNRDERDARNSSPANDEEEDDGADSRRSRGPSKPSRVDDEDDDDGIDHGEGEDQEDQEEEEGGSSRRQNGIDEEEEEEEDDDDDDIQGVSVGPIATFLPNFWPLPSPIPDPKLTCCLRDTGASVAETVARPSSISRPRWMMKTKARMTRETAKK